MGLEDDFIGVKGEAALLNIGELSLREDNIVSFLIKFRELKSNRGVSYEQLMVGGVCLM